MELAGRRAIVTGGAAGIGRGIVLGLLEAGAQVEVHDIDASGLQQLSDDLGESAGQITTTVVDVADPVAVRAAVEEAHARGPVDILVNNAGINIVKHPFDFTDEDVEQVLGVNVRGTWTYSQAVGRNMAATGGGSIVNVASLASKLASYRRAPYMASKGAIGMLTKALALDLAEHGIRVNAVGPGAVTATGMSQNPGGLQDDLAVALTPMRRRVTPAEVADTVVFLASNRASMITGQLLMVDGGLSAGTQIGSPWKPSQES